jgi:DNA-binding CsgD family transcriptional regulator
VATPPGGASARGLARGTCPARGEELRYALWTRWAARWLSGDVGHAIEDILACLRIKESHGDLHTITMAIDLLAVCLAAQKDFARAAGLCGADDAFWKMLNAPIQQGPYYAEIRWSAAETCRQAPGDERFESYRQRGLELSVAEAIAVARNEVPVPAGEISADPLTRREREIAELVTQGLGNREIAERLVLVKRTVESHIEHIFGKLGFTLTNPARRLGQPPERQLRCRVRAP